MGFISFVATALLSITWRSSCVHAPPSPPATSALYTILAHVPDNRLRQLLLILLSTIAGGPAPMEAAPAAPRATKRRHGGWPKGKRRGRPRKVAAADPADLTPYAKLRARRKRDADSRRAKRALARQAKAASGSNGGASNGHGATAASTPTGEALWAKAEALQPKTPWRTVARAFDQNEALCLDAFRTRCLPPGVLDSAVERFLETPAP
jgi:hypothetical protein